MHSTLCSSSLNVLSIVGSLKDSVVNGNVQSVRQFLTAETARPVSSKHQPIDDNMTLVMLAARHGELFYERYFTVNNSVTVATTVVFVCRTKVKHGFSRPRSG